MDGHARLIHPVRHRRLAAAAAEHGIMLVTRDPGAVYAYRTLGIDSELR